MGRMVLALLLAGGSMAAQTTHTERPSTPPPLPTLAPLTSPLPSAVVPATTPDAPPPETAAPLSENLVTFDPSAVELNWSGGGWQLAAGGVVLKDFGRREAEAREALHVIRELRLSQHGAIGEKGPLLEYWLADGQAPRGLAPDLRMLALDPKSLRVEETQAQWCLRDGPRVLFNFGRRGDDARQAMAIIRKYGFTRVGVIGQASPSMIVFVANSDDESRPAAVAHHASSAAPGHDPAPAPTAPPAGSLAEKMLAQVPGAGMSGLVAPAVPPLRQAGAAGAPLLPGVDDLTERTSFDWRQTQVRQDKDSWRLTAGGVVLADFGRDEYAARLAYSALHYYRFTERCQVGGAEGGFSYFLVNGQAPRGVLFGVANQPILADRLQVRQVGDQWAVCQDEQPVVRLGAKQAEAKQVLDVIRRNGFDRLCRVGTGDKGMTFLVKTR